MSSRSPVVFLGMCSGDKDLIRDWAARGELPTLARLLGEGAVGTTRGLPGVYVGTSWPSWITACHPGKNRVHSWTQLEAGSYRSYRCVTGQHMQRRQFWEYLSDAGRRVCILDVPHSRLSPGLNGIQTVEWGAHDDGYGFCASSPELEHEIRTRFGLHPVSGHSYAMIDPARPLEFRDKLLRGIAMKRDLTRHFLARERWDFFAQVFTEAHCAGHYLWSAGKRDGDSSETPSGAVKDVYVAIDQALGVILAEVDREATVIFNASHGMGPKHDAQHLFDRILIELGYAARRLPQPPRRTWRDIVDPPLTAAWQSLPSGLRARLVPLRDLKREVVNPSAPPPALIDPAAGLVFTVVNNNAHGAIRVNLMGREPAGRVAPGAEYDELLEAITMDLKGVVNLATGRPIVDAIHRCDALYAGPERDHLPDLFVTWATDSPVEAIGSNRLPRLEGQYRYVRSGDHRPDGMFVVTSPSLRSGRIEPAVRCMDFAPTIAALLDVALPDDIDGRAIAALGG